MFLSAGDLPVIRKVLQHMYYPLVEQVKRKVSRLSFTVKNLTVGCLTFTLANQSVHGLGGMINFKKIINTRRVNFAREFGLSYAHISHIYVSRLLS